MDSQQENSVNNDAPEKSQKSVLIKDTVEDTDFEEILESQAVKDSTISEDTILEYYTILSDLHVDLNVLFSVHNNPDDTDELSSIGYQFTFNGTPMQVIFVPDEEYNTIISEYSLLEDLVKTSNHQLFGGEFEPGITKKEFDTIVDNSLNNLSSEQLSHILSGNRNIQLTLLEIHLSGLASSNPLPVQVNFRRIGPDFVGTSIVHHMYNESMKMDTLYDKLANVSTLQSAYIGHLGASYLSGGVAVPDDIYSYAEQVESKRSSRKGIGYQ